MKCITGGYDNDVKYTYRHRCKYTDPQPPLKYDATDTIIASGENFNVLHEDAKSRCGGFSLISCVFDKVTSK